ncbi:MAG: GTP-binding protein [Stenomitos rutilans HA7619-LM2]|jgi:small GTP-binding protein|nr:GTP-binding protein [Stenomitos rutilans HA7619-LM2]
MSTGSKSTLSKKMCLIGDFGVGKTSLIRRFVDRQFSDQYLSTVGVKISRKLVEGQEPGIKDLQLLIWDIEGSTKFKAIAPSYLQGAKAAIVVGDVTRQETLDRLSEHVESFLAINPQGVVAVALNKADLVEEKTLIDLLQLLPLQNQPRVLTVCATSAKTGKAVDDVFQTLTQQMMESE